MSKPKNDGKRLEEKWQEAANSFSAENPTFLLRLYDTHSARAMLPAQPGDFIWTLPGAAVLVECKSTAEGEPLRTLLDKQQIAKHRLWHRSGHPSLFVYADLALKGVRLYEGRDVVQHFLNHSKLEDFARGPMKDMMAHVQQAFVHYAQHGEAA